MKTKISNPALTLLALLFGFNVWADELTHPAVLDPLSFVSNWQVQVDEGKADISLDELKQQLPNYRVIHVGEIHPNFEDHLVQLAMLQSLHQQHRKVAIGVEWFQAAFQPWLDAYIFGQLSEADLLHHTEYFQRWRFDYRLLQPIIHYAKRHQIPVLALNAPNELTRQVSTLGRDSLSLIQRQAIPSIHPPGVEQHQRLTRFFSDKIPPSRNLEDFIYAQRIWDETMAANAVRFLQQHPEHKLLVFAGNFHIGHFEAIPKDIARQLPELQNQQLTISGGSFENYRENFVDRWVYTDTISLPEHGKLGASFNGKSACIQDLSDDAAAIKAGLKKDDCICALNQQTIQHYADLILALYRTQPNQAVSLKIQRGEHIIELDITLD
ncbi:ChaN family lipoprotein [Thiomicrospira microaerophila]|uniref:ChaN family lipoprotein n=1 Tax=Thiomicrospira microaerophila TaxID=406020 RepID=UPI00200DF64D|nr:ChaN family lipoprotein [Thiomicrospira microaerophila]UQB42744.1 ChaN family lipoprotein [Thiomicrospira microaerophila]